MAWLYMTSIAILYVMIPNQFVALFRGHADVSSDRLAIVVPVLLRFVAVYSLFDSMNAIFSFALRGAGDTLYVTAVSLSLSWPLLVLPTAVIWYFHWGLYWAWTCASVYVICVGLVFLNRFRRGKWKSMRVIETKIVLEESTGEPASALVAEIQEA
jgi:MATE family multidrug resistance protein